MVELDEDTKRKVDGDDSKKKKKEPKKTKKDDGPDESNDVTADGKDKKKVKSKKEKSEATPLDATKSPKPKKGKKLGSSEHDVKDDKPAEKKKKDDPTLDERADSEAVQKSDAPVQSKMKKKKASDEGIGEEVNPGEVPPKDATPTQTKPKTKKNKKVVSDTEDNEENAEGETTSKDTPNAQPKMKRRKSKKNLMADSSDDDLEIKSDHVKKKKGKKPDTTAGDEEGDTKTKVKKGKKNALPDSEREGEARLKTKKKHKISELSGENVDSTKKKKKKRSEPPEVSASVTESAPLESSAQSNDAPTFSLPATTGALDASPKIVPSEENATNGVENSQEPPRAAQSETTKSEDAAEVTVGSPSHAQEAPSADYSPKVPPLFSESEITNEKHEGADHIFGDSTETKDAIVDPNQGVDGNDEPSPNIQSELPSVDVASEATETKVNSSLNLAEDSKATENALPTIVEAIASGNPESTPGVEVSEVLSVGVPSLGREGDGPPVALVTGSTNDGGIKQAVTSPATELTASEEVGELQSHDAVQESTKMTTTTESANLEETSNQGESHQAANVADTANAAGNMDSLQVSSESRAESIESSVQDVEPKPEELNQQTKAINNHVGLGINEPMNANVALRNTDGHEAGEDSSETKTLADSILHDARKSIEVTVDDISPDVQLQHTDTNANTEIKQTSDQVADDGSQAVEAPSEIISAQEPSIQSIAKDIPQNGKSLDQTSLHEEATTIEVAADGKSEDAQVKHPDSPCKEDSLNATLTNESKSSDDDETVAKKVISDMGDHDKDLSQPSSVEVVVADAQETQRGDIVQDDVCLVQANVDVTEQIKDTVEIKEKESILVFEHPKELLAVCEAMTGLVKDDESCSKEMNRLKEQLLILIGSMHEERISLHARLQKQETELLKSEEKIEKLEDEIEKQLADWDVVEVKLGQADLEIRKLLAENQRLGHELEVVSKAGDSNGDPSDLSAVNESLKNFSDEIATAKSDLEELQKEMDLQL